jgi:hypothetical protein
MYSKPSVEVRWTQWVYIDLLFELLILLYTGEFSLSRLCKESIQFVIEKLWNTDKFKSNEHDECAKTGYFPQFWECFPIQYRFSIKHAINIWDDSLQNLCICTKSMYRRLDSLQNYVYIGATYEEFDFKMLHVISTFCIFEKSAVKLWNLLGNVLENF